MYGSAPQVLIYRPIDLFLGCYSNLWYKEVGIGALLLGEKPLSISPQELFACECDLLCSLSPVVWSHEVYCYWHCSCSLYNCICWQLALVTLRPLTGTGPLRSGPRFHWDQVPGSTKVKSQDCSSYAPELTMGAIQAAQILFWPTSCMCMHKRPQMLMWDPSELWVQLLSFQMLHRCWI